MATGVLKLRNESGTPISSVLYNFSSGNKDTTLNFDNKELAFSFGTTEIRYDYSHSYGIYGSYEEPCSINYNKILTMDSSNKLTLYGPTTWDDEGYECIYNYYAYRADNIFLNDYNNSITWPMLSNSHCIQGLIRTFFENYYTLESQDEMIFSDWWMDGCMANILCNLRFLTLKFFFEFSEEDVAEGEFKNTLAYDKVMKMYKVLFGCIHLPKLEVLEVVTNEPRIISAALQYTEAPKLKCFIGRMDGPRVIPSYTASNPVLIPIRGVNYFPNLRILYLCDEVALIGIPEGSEGYVTNVTPSNYNCFNTDEIIRTMPSLSHLCLLNAKYLKIIATSANTTNTFPFMYLTNVTRSTSYGIAAAVTMSKLNENGCNYIAQNFYIA